MTSLSIMPDTPQWKEARRWVVTSTDVGKIMGTDSTCSAKKLMDAKFSGKDLMDGASETTLALIRMGRIFEQTVKEAYEESLKARGCPVGFVPGLYGSTTYEYLVGTPDYLIPKSKMVAEFKTHFFPNPNDSNPIRSVDTVPLKYYLQLETYLEIMGWDLGELVSWSPSNGWTVHTFRRDPSLFPKISPILESFYHDLARGKDHPEEREGLAKRQVWRRGEKAIFHGMIQKSLLDSHLGVTWNPNL